jgi:uncharacterized damage-inducible protein DinB
MTSTAVPDPVEPARSTSERDTLVEFLDWYRAVLIRKSDGLTPDELGATLGRSTLTVGRLIRHMTFVEHHWFHHAFLGNEYLEPWASAPWDHDADWEMTTANGLGFDQLRADFDAACTRSREIVAAVGDLKTIAALSSHDRDVSLRWILVHMIEEYARHCGHADLLRESIDGRVGD